jgi:hypothetical protein
MIKIQIPLLFLDQACDITEAYYEEHRINFGDGVVFLTWEEKTNINQLRCFTELQQLCDITILSEGI